MEFEDSEPSVDDKVTKMPQKKRTHSRGGYDSDEEREKAHLMFSDNVQGLRKLFLKVMDD
jgi:hypothetical protein